MTRWLKEALTQHISLREVVKPSPRLLALLNLGDAPSFALLLDAVADLQPKDREVPVLAPLLHALPAGPWLDSLLVWLRSARPASTTSKVASMVVSVGPYPLMYLHRLPHVRTISAEGAEPAVSSVKSGGTRDGSSCWRYGGGNAQTAISASSR